MLCWQLVCLATFLKVSENDSFDPYQVVSSFPYELLEGILMVLFIQSMAYRFPSNPFLRRICVSVCICS
jgi:hypothetical protein